LVSASDQIPESFGMLSSKIRRLPGVVGEVVEFPGYVVALGDDFPIADT